MCISFKCALLLQSNNFLLNYSLINKFTIQKLCRDRSWDNSLHLPKQKESANNEELYSSVVYAVVQKTSDCLKSVSYLYIVSKLKPDYLSHSLLNKLRQVMKQYSTNAVTLRSMHIQIIVAQDNIWSYLQILTAQTMKTNNNE